jgi:hypothetical protein
MAIFYSFSKLGLRYAMSATVAIIGFLSILGSGGDGMIQASENNERRCVEGLKTANFGKMPKNYRKIIESYMEKVLKDPDSAKYFWDDALGPKSGTGFDVGSASCQGYGWAVCVSINAKNSYGGYTGPKSAFFLIRDDAVVYHENNGPGHFSSFNCNEFSKRTL